MLIKHQSYLFKKFSFSRANLLIFILVFAAIGGYFVYQSLAATQTTANLWVDTTGGTCTRQATPGAYNDAAACGSFDAANDLCQNGDIVLIKAGAYVSQSFSGSNSRTNQCTFMAASGETVTAGGLSFGGAAWIDLSDVTVTGGTSSSPKTVSMGGGSSTTADHVTITNVSAYPGRIFMKGTFLTVKGGEFGGYDACLTGSEDDGIQVSYVTQASSNITIDGIYLHDIRRTCGSTHTDCIQFLGVDGGVIKNSKIQNCPTTGIIARPQGGSNILNNLRIENNFVGPILDGSEAYNIGTSPDNCTNIVISYNTFADGGSIDCVTITGNTVRGNLIAGGASCSDATYSYNAWTSGTACGSNGRICTASYVNTSTGDYHLKSTDTCAIGRGDPANFPATDIDGDSRPQASVADLGADEVASGGAGGDTTPPTVSMTAPSDGATVSNNVTVSASASDDIGVAGVQFKLDGSNLGSEDTSSPYSITWDSTGAVNGSHTLTAVARDSAGNTTSATSITVTTSNTTTCTQSSSSWQNSSMGMQTGSFNFSFDATPNGSNIDGLTGLSNGLAAGFSDLAVIVRFNTTGFIDAINGSGYSSVSSIPYTSGTSYHFSISVNRANHTYSATVTPSGGSQINLAANYAFRTEQASVGSLNNWALFSDAGTHNVCNISVSTGTPVVGDINSDGFVNITDLSILLSHYGQVATAAQGDINTDGTVTILDLSILLSNYGT